MRRHEVQVEAKVIFNIAVDAESLDATKDQIQAALEEDLARINNAIFHQCVSDVHRRRVELKDWNIRNYISYIPKVISVDDRHELWDRLTENKDDSTDDEDDLTEDEDDE